MTPAHNTSRHRKLNNSIPGQHVNTSGRQEVLRGLCAAHDLEENWNIGSSERDIIDEELTSILIK